jgi:hypothetical protein
MSDDVKTVSQISRRDQTGTRRNSKYSRSNKSFVQLTSDIVDISDFSEHVLKIAWPNGKTKKG